MRPGTASLIRTPVRNTMHHWSNFFSFYSVVADAPSQELLHRFIIFQLTLLVSDAIWFSLLNAHCSSDRDALMRNWKEAQAKQEQNILFCGTKPELKVRKLDASEWEKFPIKHRNVDEHDVT